MRNIAIAVVLGALAMAVAGCMDSRIGKADPFQTPAYSGQERGEMIARNMEMEWKMMNDDIDHVLLLRPVTSLSMWNVR